MRQLQRTRTGAHRRPVEQVPQPVVPTSPAARTAAAASLLETISVLLEERDQTKT